jgi:hypothetical protein
VPRLACKEVYGFVLRTVGEVRLSLWRNEDRLLCKFAPGSMRIYRLLAIREALYLIQQCLSVANELIHSLRGE